MIRLLRATFVLAGCLAIPSIGVAQASPVAATQSSLKLDEKSPPKITQVEPRIWSCDFASASVGKAMRFLVVLPEKATLQSPPIPVIYFLHGRGRNEQTLLDQPGTRPRVLASPCAIVLPRGREGWYINSPVVREDRYADYVDEVISLAEKYFPVGRTPAMRAIGGWSMGGYGATYTACRRPGDFAAVAPIIGILDFPRPEIPEKGQNYKVPDRFGQDEAKWNELNPRLLMDRLHGVPLFVAFADRAPERQMNQEFIADAKAKGYPIEVVQMSGGHTFPMVEQGLPPALSFLEKALAPTDNAVEAKK